MNIEITCEEIATKGSYVGKIIVVLDDIEVKDLDNKDVANCVSIDTFVDTHGIDDILNYMGDSAVIGYLELKGYLIDK